MSIGFGGVRDMKRDKKNKENDRREKWKNVIGENEIKKLKKM